MVETIVDMRIRILKSKNDNKTKAKNRGRKHGMIETKIEYIILLYIDIIVADWK